jgi:acetyltransferase
MAGSETIWQGFYRQTGAVRVDTLEEMAETAMAFQMLRPLPGARAAVMTVGGGSTVQSGDLCGRANLAVPRFSPETQKEIASFVSSTNQGLSNPMDIPGVLRDPVALPRLLRLLAGDPNVDVLLVGLPVESALGGFDHAAQVLADFNREAPHGRQVAAAVTDNWGPHEIERQCRVAREMGVPLFRTFTGACRALNRVAGYYLNLA